MSLLAKVVLSFVCFVVALAGVNILATSAIIDRRVRAEVETSEAVFAKSLATRIAKSTRAKDKVPITEIVLDEQGLRSEKIEYVLVFDKAGAVLAHTYLSPMPASLRGLSNAFDSSGKKVTRLEDQGLYAYDVAVPVVEGIEQVGAIHVGLRGEYLDGIKHDIIRASLVASGAIVLVAFVIAVLIGFLLVRPLELLTREVDAISAGRWESLEALKSHVRGRDEVGLLGTAFANMATTVQDKTRAMKLVLDNVGDGLMTAGMDGIVSPEVSAEAERWFGKPGKDQRIADYLFPVDEHARVRFELGFSELVDDLLPFELLADQALQRFAREGRVFELEYRQVFENERVDRFLVIARDVTARVQAEADHDRAEELHAIVGTMLKDRVAFRQFRKDVGDILGRLAVERDRVVQKRDLHTLKGNLAIFGFLATSRECHRCEDEMFETDGLLPAERVEHLAECWQRSLSELGSLVPLDDVANEVPLRAPDYERILRKIEQHSEHETLLSIVKSWKLVPAASLLASMGAQAKRLGTSIGREVDFHVLDHDVRVDIDRTADFWSSMIHVVRNAVDHGIESEEERRAKGKSPVGTLSLATYSERGSLIVVVSDDGRGIDWERVRERGGFPPNVDRRVLVDALFTDGFSTRSEVTEVSGRGVGLGALKAACDARGVAIEVKSAIGKGTSFVFRFPAEHAGPPVHVSNPSMMPARPLLAS
ncbi:MAG: HAMP domain-containing protein [Myxococcales bacterium]|nr:HAMP domain-containing protein [Myxococcales bacterium]